MTEYREKAKELIKLCEDHNYFESKNMFYAAKITALELVNFIKKTTYTIPHTNETIEYYIELENELNKIRFEDYEN